MSKGSTMRKALITIATVLAVLTVASLLGFVWTEEAKFGWTAMVLAFAAVFTLIATVEA
jgi:hypothetical protein